MKKTLTLIILTIIFHKGFSQHFNYGIGAGLNYNSLILTNFGDQKSNYKIGFEIHGLLEYELSNKFGFRIEPGFVNRGATIISPTMSEAKYNFNYINLPLLLKFSPVEKFSILIGPELSYQISAKYNTTDVEKLFDSRLDLGVNAGLSYNILENVDLGLRYYRGFISTVKDLTFTDISGNYLGKTSMYNQGFTFSITYKVGR